MTAPRVTPDDKLAAVAIVRAWAHRDLVALDALRAEIRPGVTLALVALASALAGAAAADGDPSTVLDQITTDTIQEMNR